MAGPPRLGGRRHRVSPRLLGGRISSKICERSVTNLIQRYEELVGLHVLNCSRIMGRLQAQGRAVLAGLAAIRCKE